MLGLGSVEGLGLVVGLGLAVGLGSVEGLGLVCSPGLHLLSGSDESCQVVHWFVPPHCLPSRHVTVSIGSVEPLVAVGFTAEFPLAAAVFRKQHLGKGAREQGQPEARARGRSNSRFRGVAAHLPAHV